MYIFIYTRRLTTKTSPLVNRKEPLPLDRPFDPCDRGFTATRVVLDPRARQDSRFSIYTQKKKKKKLRKQKSSFLSR